jgi:hypothetical protein
LQKKQTIGRNELSIAKNPDHSYLGGLALFIIGLSEEFFGKVLEHVWLQGAWVLSSGDGLDLEGTDAGDVYELIDVQRSTTQISGNLHRDVINKMINLKDLK